MPLQTSGTIKLTDVRSELARSGSISLTDSQIRTLTSKPTGTVKLSDCRSKFYMVQGYTSYYDYTHEYYNYYSGYLLSQSIGSLKRATILPGGQTITGFYDYSDYSGTATYLEITGFSSDPGVTGFFSSVYGENNSRVYASAVNFYNYSGGTAFWQWFPSYMFSGSGDTGCELVQL